MRRNRLLAWLCWLLPALALGGYLAYRLFHGDQTMYLPGPSTHGHYQIEMACHVCHTPFQREVKQDACVRCHGEALQAGNDSHPKSKFTDPRHAPLMAALDARQCVTCHREHQPEITKPMGVTVTSDFCFHCHADIAQERPSHRGLAFNTCATAGCHNYHNNTALYEKFLVKHLHEPAVRDRAAVPARNLHEFARQLAKAPVKALSAREQDAPAGVRVEPGPLHEWESTAHARAGVNCTACHQGQDPHSQAPRWQNKPGHTACQPCHAEEVKGFLAGKHGMRLAQALSPMTPGMARQPMKPAAHHQELSCTSCHGAHQFDTRRAAVESCLSCHDDAHTRAYKQSPHFGLWRRELTGQAAPGSGVSCATCHLPRETHKQEGRERVRVQHNQNANLRPNEKMVRDVCMNCHGLGLSLDALADTALMQRNFQGRPGRHLDTLDMVERRLGKGKK
jgi:predicted CXXCH cytochrome family protein